MVLDAAFELFMERGYDATTMDAVAAAAGVSKPVVYDCFAGKDELFQALLRREEARVLDEIGSAISAAADLGDPERFLTESFTALLRAVAASPAAYRVVFLGEGGANAAVARRVQRGRERQLEVIATIARSWLERRDDGAEVERRARLIAFAVVGLAEGGARALLSEPDAHPPEQLGAALGRIAARGLTAA